MAKQKGNQILIVSPLERGLRGVILLLLIALSLSSCKKRYDETPTTIEVSLRNPVTDIGYAGLRINVIGIQYEQGENEIRELIETAVTDENGEASLSFNRATYHDLSRKDYDYEITFDKTMIEAPPGEYYSTIPLGFVKPNFGQLNDYNFKFIPYGNRVRYFKNMNCLDENDVVMFKQLKVYTGTYDFDQLPWLGGTDLFMGCTDEVQTNIYTSSDIYIYQIKVTRNGIDSIYYDTFINHPYVTDTFKIFY